ncbi:MAG: glycosyltransferase [Armatimonadetes bacterium]|nr:glycosyltransferase [Armatimonadota bacterium]
MRVLHLINDLRRAGAERLVTDLCTVQRNSGLSVSVAPLAPCGSPLETLIAGAGVPLLLPPRMIPIRSPAHIFPLRRLFRGFDLVHVHLFPAQLWAFLAAASLGKSAPVLVTTEHNTYNSRRSIPVFRPVDAAMYAAYRKIAAISDATKTDLAAYLPATAPRIAVVTNGITLGRFAGVGSPDERAALFPGVPVGALLLLSVGRLEPQKDFATLLRAVAMVENAHLVIVGTGHLLTPLQELARSLGIESRGHFFGGRDDVPTLLRNADAYAQSSAWEGFGIAAVEAMASGLPLVITDVPGLRDVVGDAGIVVPPANAQALANAIRTLASDAAKRNELGSIGRERAATFSIEACADAYAALYGEAISPTP